MWSGHPIMALGMYNCLEETPRQGSQKSCQCQKTETSLDQILGNNEWLIKAGVQIVPPFGKQNLCIFI